MANFLDFTSQINWHNLPVAVQAQAKRCLLDTLGVAIAGSQTELASIAAQFALDHHGATPKSRSSLIGFDGECSVPGAALAGGLLIDAFDAHDGHKLTKGHAGATVIPSLLAICSGLANQGIKVSGKSFLEALVVGYEVSLRCGIALHKETEDYPTSGAWAAVGVAAMGNCLLDLNQQQLEHALGIAEYYGPRSPMMRCIDHPTMLKDGAGWGALAGTSALFLAQAGFTGAPSTLISDYSENTYFDQYEILQQYFKPWPVCRWAQPAVEAIKALLDENSISAESIEQISIETFHEAVRLGNKLPQNTEEAQYSIGFPVAAYTIRGELGAKEILAETLRDQNIQQLQRRIVLKENSRHNHAFPERRYASVTILLKNGEEFSKKDVEASGDPHLPLPESEILDKFNTLSAASFNLNQQHALITLIDSLDQKESCQPLLDTVLTVF